VSNQEVRAQIDAVIMQIQAREKSRRR